MINKTVPLVLSSLYGGTFKFQLQTPQDPAVSVLSVSYGHVPLQFKVTLDELSENVFEVTTGAGWGTNLSIFVLWAFERELLDTFPIVAVAQSLFRFSYPRPVITPNTLRLDDGTPPGSSCLNLLSSDSGKSIWVRFEGRHFDFSTDIAAYEHHATGMQRTASVADALRQTNTWWVK